MYGPVHDAYAGTERFAGFADKVFVRLIFSSYSSESAAPELMPMKKTVITNNFIFDLQ
jgi:hypothetical protein